jgi:hypothetical protein
MRKENVEHDRAAQQVRQEAGAAEIPEVIEMHKIQKIFIRAERRNRRKCPAPKRNSTRIQHKLNTRRFSGKRKKP